MFEKRQHLVRCLPWEAETTLCGHELCRSLENTVEPKQRFPEVAVVGTDVRFLVFVPHIRGQETFQMFSLGSQ